MISCSLLLGSLAKKNSKENFIIAYATTLIKVSTSQW